MIDKSEAPIPPPGHELIWSGTYLEGDLFWQPKEKEWKKAQLRIGHPIDMYRTPPARPLTEASKEDLNHLFGIKDKDTPKTTGDHW